MLINKKDSIFVAEEKYLVQFLDIEEPAALDNPIFNNRVARNEYERFFYKNLPKNLIGKSQYIDCYNRKIVVNIFSKINKNFQYDIIQNSLLKLFNYFHLNKINSIGILYAIDNKDNMKLLRKMIEENSKIYQIDISLYKK